MDIITKRIGDRIGAWDINLTNGELEAYGWKYGYCTNNRYQVDTAISHGYESAIVNITGPEYGPQHAELYGPQQYGLFYSVTNCYKHDEAIDIETYEEATRQGKDYVVQFNLRYLRLAGADQDLKGRRYTYYTSRPVPSKRTPDIMKKFVRDLVKDGLLAFFPPEEPAQEEEPKATEPIIGTVVDYRGRYYHVESEGHNPGDYWAWPLKADLSRDGRVKSAVLIGIAEARRPGGGKINA